jgi:putative ABC transport system substrate-binding protein
MLSPGVSEAGMRRREFIGILGGAGLAWPLAALAQQSGRTRRIGVLMGFPETDAQAKVYFATFRETLENLGWTEDRNILIDVRWAKHADLGSMQSFAKELVALSPDLILSNTTPTTAALLGQTHTIPVVFAMIADPVGSGFVASFARPGGNATGFVVTDGSLGGKWLQLLKEIAPHVTTVAMLFNPAVATYQNSGSIHLRPLLLHSLWMRPWRLFAIFPSLRRRLPRNLGSRMAPLL